MGSAAPGWSPQPKLSLGQGFKEPPGGAALSMIQLVTRPSYPMKVFADLTAASTWLAPEVHDRAGRGPTSDWLAQVAADAYVRFLAPSSGSVARAPPERVGIDRKTFR